MAPDDPVNNQPAPDAFLFSGDGDRVQEEDAPPEIAPPPEGQPDAATLQDSGMSATRHVLATPRARASSSPGSSLTPLRSAARGRRR